MSMFSKLPWSSSRTEHPPEGENQDQSLTTILPTAEDRSQLLLLIADCTAPMRKTIVDTFDSNKTLRKPLLPSRPLPEDASEAQRKQASKKDVDEQRKDNEAYDRRVEEITSQPILDLKKAALDHFDEWRERILERIGQAMNEQTGSDDAAKPKPSTQKAAVNSKDELVIHTSDENAELVSIQSIYTPQKTPLVRLPEPQRILILHSLLLLLLSLEKYPSHSRTLLLNISSSLSIPPSILSTDESKVAQGLLEAVSNAIDANAETEKRAKKGFVARKWKVGLGVVAGAALIGVTGGLAAPLLAAGVGSVMGGLGLGSTVVATYLGALAGSAPLVGALFGAYGGRMTGKMVDSYAKEVSDFAFLPVKDHRVLFQHDEKEERRLRVAIGIAGWLNNQDDIVNPWRVLAPSIEAFALRWEFEALMDLGGALTAYIKSYAWSAAEAEIIRHTLFATLMAGLWPLGLLKVARVVDNPFTVAKNRSDKAGEVLADALINKVQGERPVTLIGYSLGARIIYSCLNTLADRKAFGLVESAVLLGAPAPSNALGWRKMRTVVTGRLVNVYSTKDYLLGFLYRSSSLQYGVAGLQPIEELVGVENVDVTDLIDGHTKYKLSTGEILQRINFEDVDAGEVENQENAQKKEEKQIEEESKAHEAEVCEGEDEETLEKEAEKQKQQGMMAYVSGAMSKIGLGKSNTSAPKQEKEITELETPDDAGINKP